MRYSNEIKVGIAVIVTAVVFVLGIRFFEDIPLFRSTHNLVVEFDNAGGLISGNVVRVSGVSVGSVNDVSISAESGAVRVLFHVDREVPVTEGSYAQIAGFDAIGVVRMDLFLGPPDAPRIPEGGMIEGRAAANIMGDLSDRAPMMMDQLGSVLDNMNTVLAETGAMMSQPESDFRQTLSAINQSVETLDSILRAERVRIHSILENVDSATAGLDSLIQESGQDLPGTIANLNNALASLDQTLEGLDGTSTRLNTLLDKLNSGEGTLGRLVNDSALYEKMDSTLNGLNALLIDFKANPGKYLKEMRIIDLF